MSEWVKVSADEIRARADDYDIRIRRSLDPHRGSFVLTTAGAPGGSYATLAGATDAAERWLRSHRDFDALPWLA